MFIGWIFVGALGALLSGPAHAEFPDRTVKIVVPFDAGGTHRCRGSRARPEPNEKWNVPVIVENRPGAGNTIGAAAVAKAAPDGTTLLFANTSVSVNPSLFKTLPYDTLRDLAPVIYLSPSPNVLLAQQSLGVEFAQGHARSGEVARRQSAELSPRSARAARIISAWSCSRARPVCRCCTFPIAASRRPCWR